MTPKHLLDAMTDIDEESILEAKNPPAHKKVLSRRGAVVLVAAVMLMTMVVTACASPDTAEWFRTFFHNAGQRQLSEGQLQYINENTVSQNQSQTCNGYTITVDSAISDGVRGFIKMTITGPEGTVMDADAYFCNEYDLRDGNWNDPHRGGGLDSIDDDPADNIVPVVYELIPPVGTTDIAILTEHTWTFRLEDLYAGHWINCGTSDVDLKKTLLASGVWEFQIKFAKDTTVVELIDEPVPCYAEVSQWPEWGDEEILITSLRLRAMSADMTFTFPEKGTEVNAWLDDIYVVMKDGSQILMRGSGGWPDNFTFAFDAPIALEEVSHVLLPNGTKIPMP